MAAIRTNEDSVRLLRAYFEAQGYEVSKQRSFGEQGADIIAKREQEVLAVEVIAYKSNGPGRRKDFFEAIFGALQRLGRESKPTEIGIGIAKEALVGFQTRVNNIGPAWDRFGAAFPEFCFWFVDFDDGSVTKKRWSEFTASA